MKPFRAGVAAALSALFLTAVCAHAQAAAPFPVVPQNGAPKGAHGWSDAAIVSGIALIASSFWLERVADRSYDDYLGASDPARINSLYDRTTRYDRLSSTALIGGNGLLATGLVFRFIIHAHGSRVALDLEARRCALACAF